MCLFNCCPFSVYFRLILVLTAFSNVRTLVCSFGYVIMLSVDHLLCSDFYVPLFLHWTFVSHSCECSANSSCSAARDPGAGCTALSLLRGFCCRHTLIKKLSQLRTSEPELAQLLVDQVSPWSRRTEGCQFCEPASSLEAGQLGVP